jgi:hypothetical protein
MGLTELMQIVREIHSAAAHQFLELVAALTLTRSEEPVHRVQRWSTEPARTGYGRTGWLVSL